MQEFVQHLQFGQDLSVEQIQAVIPMLLDVEHAAAEKAEFLKALNVKGETAAEISAFVREFLKYAVVPEIRRESLDGPLLDVVGTGGDKLNLFNISTTAMFILAAGGVNLVKHGNRGITSKSGGADVLEALGVRIDLGPEELGRCIHEIGVGFVFAPLYHPTFKAVVEARKILGQAGQRSIFNMLGPLLNPVCPEFQLLGVYDATLVPVFAQILQDLGRQSAWVFHGYTEDGRGMDELSVLGRNIVWELKNGELREVSFNPEDVGLQRGKLEDLAGGNAAENANILEDVLAGRLLGAKRDTAVLNAAAGFYITGKANSLMEGCELANSLLDNGCAHAKLKRLQNWL